MRDIPVRRAMRHSSTSTSAETTDTSDGDDESSTFGMPMRHQILRASLAQVPAYGWTRDAVAAAAAEESCSVAVAGLVDPSELVQFWMDDCRQRLQRDLAVLAETEWKSFANPNNNNATKLRDRVATALQTRLAYTIPYLQSSRWHQAMALGARPDNVWTTRLQIEQLVETVADAVTVDHGEGDKLPAWSEPQKLGLGAVYVAAELHMLADTSNDYADTWAFVRDRVQEWEQLVGVASLWPTLPNTNELSYKNINENSNPFYVASAVASSVTSGVLSLLVPQTASSIRNGLQRHAANSYATSPAHLLWNVMVQISPAGGTGTKVDATNPRYYQATSKSSDSGAASGETK